MRVRWQVVRKGKQLKVKAKKKKKNSDKRQHTARTCLQENDRFR